MKKFLLTLFCFTFSCAALALTSCGEVPSGSFDSNSTSSSSVSNNSSEGSSESSSDGSSEQSSSQVPEKKTVTVSFNAAGGTFADGAATSKQVTEGDALGELPVVSHTAAVFGGWYNGTVKVDAATVSDYKSDVELTAKWLTVASLNPIELHLNRTDKAAEVNVPEIKDSDGNIIADAVVTTADAATAKTEESKIVGLANGATTLTVTWDGVQFEEVATVSVYSWTAVGTYAELSNIKNNLEGNYYLTADIKGSGDFEVIAPYDGSEKVFGGRLDGCGYIISGYRITDGWWKWNNGIFGTVGKKGIVENLSVNLNSPVGAVNNWGSIAAINDGTIRNCKVVINLTHGSPSDQVAGAIVGSNGFTGTIENCIAYVNGTVTEDERFAAVAGLNQGAIVNTYAVSEIYEEVITQNGTLTGVECYLDADFMETLADFSQYPETVWDKTGIPELKCNRPDFTIPVTEMTVENHPDKQAPNKIIAYDKYLHVITEDIMFVSSVPAVVTVATDGTLTAVSDGSATVTITHGGETLTVNVTSVCWKAVGTYAEFKAICSDITSRYYLTADIDGGGVVADVIAPWDGSNKEFTGALDGRGYTIGNLYISDGWWLWNDGLFGTIAKNAVVENLNIDVKGPKQAVNVWGTMAAVNNGIVRNCKVTVEITHGAPAGQPSGALVCQNNGRIENCIAVVKGEIPEGEVFGALIGGGPGTLTNCFAVASYAPMITDNGIKNNIGVYETETALLAAADFSAYNSVIWLKEEGKLPVLKKKN